VRIFRQLSESPGGGFSFGPPKSQAGQVSVIRVDAVIVWLDPRPVRSGPGARPVRVTMAGSCPATDRGVTGVTNPAPG